MRRESTETVALDLQRTIESRAHILERDSRSQIDNLLSVEMALEFVEDLVGHVNGAERHLLCIAECGAFGGREQRIFGGVRERGEFVVADSKLAATGSVDVYSEDAADHLRGAQANHPLQRRRGDFGRLDRLHENRHRQRDSRPIRPRLDWIDDFADLPLHHPDERLQHPAHLLFFDWLDTHWNKLRLRSSRWRGANFIRLTIEDGADRD